VRAATFAKVLSVAEGYVRDSKALLLRASLLKHDLVQRGNGGERGGGGGGGGPSGGHGGGPAGGGGGRRAERHGPRHDRAARFGFGHHRDHDRHGGPSRASDD
jgi:hypothetical protein